MKMQLRAMAFVTLGNLAAIAHAQPWPAKPIRFIIAQPPGGQNDVQARIIGLKLTELWGQPVVFDNRPGAGGAIGFEIAAQAPNDGYTIAMGSISTLAVIPAMPRKPRYDPLADFAPVTLVSTSPYVVTLHPSVPARTLKELVALAKARPGALSYASSGTATGIHLTVNQGNDIAAGTPQEFAAFIRAEMDKWAKVIKAAGVRNE